VDRVLTGSITIKNLSFAYPGTSILALKNCSITLSAGKTLGIIGRTGSGKSTLANLLVRLFPVENGQIYIDEEDINSIPVEVIRENIGYVPQDNFLFSTTIKNNIAFFRNCYTDESIENAARCAEVYDTVRSFPDGFETVIGERGVTLSGGQKQRIAIARALVTNSSIMILDDSLSAVDGRTEQMILHNIREVLKNRTGIIISHRVASVKNADIIVVLEKGEIVEQGTHDELIVKDGVYRGLWMSQHGEPGNVFQAPDSLQAYNPAPMQGNLQTPN
jgi:ATP-binding cassette subfamily B protein